TDKAARAVDQRAARIAGVERGVSLDYVVDVPDGPTRSRGQRAAEGRDDSGGDRAGEAVGVPDRDNQLTDPELCSVAELGRSQVPAVRPQDGEVGQPVDPDDLELQLPSVDERGPAVPSGSCHDVCGGQQEPVRSEGDRAPGSRWHLAHTAPAHY